MNYMVLRGKRIFIAEAKYRRKHELKDVKGKEVEEPARKGQEGGPQQHKIARKMEEHVDKFARDAQGKDPNKNGWSKKIEIPVVKDNVTWLQRSIVGSTKKMINFQTLHQKIHNEWQCVMHIRELDAYKAMLMFDTLANAEEAYTFRMNDLLKLFYMVWRWDETERSETRRV
ncbi:hypothetical protein AHAS_Ahas09G0084300 [Arachis hypogaea]